MLHTNNPIIKHKAGLLNLAEELAEAMRLTLEHRGTEIPVVIIAFTKEFIEDKQVQWKAFHKRLGQEHVPTDFGVVVADIQGFLGPMINGEKVTSKWSAPRTWV